MATPMAYPLPPSKDPVAEQGPPSIVKIRNQIGEMKVMKLGFGKGMATKIIHQFLPLLDPAVDLGDPDIMLLLKKFPKTYSFFSKWSRKSHILWIKAHIHLRLSMMRMLSSKDHIYTMGQFEIETWIESVFFCIKKVVKRLFQSPSNLQETRRSNPFQTVIDGLYSLIEVMNREPCRQEIFHDYYTFLVYVSQRACLPPSSLLLDPKSIHGIQESVAGIGVTSDVFRCNLDGKLVAAKTLRISRNVKKHDKRNFLKEAIHLCLMMSHPHIIPCLGIVMSETLLRIITPWMENGDIVNYTKKRPNVSKKDLLEQVADGLHFLRQYNFVHGDLKGSNVLITVDGKACIADLGSSRLLEASTQNTAFKYNQVTPQPFFLPRSQNPSTGLSNVTSLSGMSNLSTAGTWRYMSPERILPENFGMDTARATFSSDVFSFGMLVYEVYAGHPPFHDTNEASASMRITEGQRPTRPKYIEDEVWLLATRCWSKLPDERPHIFEVYSIFAVLP